MLFFKANEENAQGVMEILAGYCRALGQQINGAKSSILFSKGCCNEVKQKLMEILDANNESRNKKYLGMPSDVGRSSNGAFKYLKDRIWKRVQGWLEHTVSVAQAVPTYSMACFLLPRGLCHHINGLLRGLV
jgi:hypothetical protein